MNKLFHVLLILSGTNSICQSISSWWEKWIRKTAGVSLGSTVTMTESEPLKLLFHDLFYRWGKKNEALLCYGLQKWSSQTTCLGDFHRTVLTSWGSSLLVGDYKSRAAAALAVFVHPSLRMCVECTCFQCASLSLRLQRVPAWLMTSGFGAWL